jgi:hypothetical protein
MPAYDNASGLPDWLSDTFCRLATGGGFSTRQLYTDDDEILFASTRPILLNGIDDIVGRPDLADRSIVLSLKEIPDDKRREETELWHEFERLLPRILGALLTAVSHGLKALPDVKLDRKPRMADFAVWATACEGALWPKGTFMAAYIGNIAEAVAIVLEDDQIATSLRRYMDLKAEFSGTATDLLNALNSIVPETQQKEKGWPKRPNVLSRVLRRIAPPLRKVGIDITFDREGRGRDRKIIITRRARVAETSSTSSTSSTANDFNGLWRTMSAETSSVPSSAAGIGGNADDKADDVDENIVRANPLINKAMDDADDKDGIFPTLTGSHICAQCGRDPPDGAERPVACRDGTVWLHPECRRFWVPPPSGIPFVITHVMKARLRELGYPDDQIATLTPAEAHAALNGNGRERRARFRKVDATPQPPDTVCACCHSPEGEVWRIRDSHEIGGKAETLHEGCAERFFCVAEGLSDDAGGEQ